MGDATEDGITDKLEQHGEAFIGFFGDVQANVLNSITSNSVGPQGFFENIQGGLRFPAPI